MGTEWNVDLLTKLALAGGGSAHFIGSKSQASQVMHEIYHSASGVVAHNVRVELEPLNSTQVIRVNDEPTSLGTGQTDTFLMTNQLMINSEEYLVARLEFPTPRTKQKVALLQCAILYEAPLSGQRRKTPDKVLYIAGKSTDLTSDQTIINQGVICTAHIISSRELYRKALDAYQAQNDQLGDKLLAQAKITLQTIPTIPEGYESRVLVQEGRIQSLEQVGTQERNKNIKRLYFEEWAHREALWEKVYLIFDQLLAASREQLLHNTDEQFMWAHRMITEKALQLPVPLMSTDVSLGEPLADYSNSSQSEEDPIMYWRDIRDWEYTYSEELARSNRRKSEQRQEEQAEPATVLALLAGACYGLEQCRQGSQEELEELLEGYLESRYKIQLWM